MDIVYKINALLSEKVYGQGLGEGLEGPIGELEGQLENSSISKESLVESIVKVAIPLSVICLILLVVYASYLLISSQGNPDKLQEGREIITNAVIGFLVVLLSAGILLLIANTLGLEIYN
jgi:hypothetical protein